MSMGTNIPYHDLRIRNDASGPVFRFDQDIFVHYQDRAAVTKTERGTIMVRFVSGAVYEFDELDDGSEWRCINRTDGWLLP